jgi:hypothetical protein
VFCTISVRNSQILTLEAFQRECGTSVQPLKKPTAMGTNIQVSPTNLNATGGDLQKVSVSKTVFMNPVKKSRLIESLRRLFPAFLCFEHRFRDTSSMSKSFSV